MKTIKGITKRQTINALKKYLIHDYNEYLCKYLYFKEEHRYIKFSEIEIFISYWAKKIYGSKIKNNLISGYFGIRFLEDSKLTRKAFVTLLIHELEK